MFRQKKEDMLIKLKDVIVWIGYLDENVFIDPNY